MPHYIDLPKKYMDWEALAKKRGEYDPITGAAGFGKVRYTTEMQHSGFPRRWLFWFSHTKYTDVLHIVTDEECKIVKVVQQSPPDKFTYTVTWCNGEKLRLAGFIKHKRASCLCFMYLVPTTNSGEKPGWIIGGSGQVTTAAITVAEANNYHRQLEDANGQELLESNRHITASLPMQYFTIFPRLFTNLPPELPSTKTQAYVTGIHHVLNNTHYIFDDNEKIEETWIGRHYGVVPRSFFYHDIRHKFRCSPRYIEFVLRQGFFLRRISPAVNGLPDFESPMKMQNLNLASDYEQQPLWLNDVVSAIIFSITVVVTRFSYQADEETLSNGHVRSFEYFNDHLTMLTGSGDCEDLQWFIHAFLQTLQHLADEIIQKVPLLHFACKVLDLYVVTAALVQASRPEFSFSKSPAQASGKFTDDAIAEIDEQTELAVEKSQQFYHETTIVVPKAWFLSHVCQEVLKDVHIQCRMKHYSRFHKEDNRDDWVLNDLSPHIAEGTASIYDGPNRVLSTDPSTPKIIEQNARQGLEPLIMLTNKNCSGASKMYATVIDMATEFFFLYDAPKSFAGPVKNTIFMCMEKTKDGRWVEGFQFDYLYNMKLQDKLKLCPLGADMLKLLKESHVQERMMLELPPVVLDVSQEYMSHVQGRILDEPIVWSAGIKTIPSSTQGISAQCDFKTTFELFSWNATVGEKNVDGLDERYVIVRY